MRSRASNIAHCVARWGAEIVFEVTSQEEITHDHQLGSHTIFVCRTLHSLLISEPEALASHHNDKEEERDGDLLNSQHDGMYLHTSGRSNQRQS